MKSLYRSGLQTTAIAKRLLNEIKTKKLTIQVGGSRFRPSEIANLAIDETTALNNITFRRSPIVAKKASKVMQGLLYTAKTAGVAGNAITVTYTTGATAGSEVVSVLGSAITVQIATGVSTAAQIKAAVDAEEDSAALVDVALTGLGSATHIAQTATALVEGADQAALEKYEIADISEIRRLRRSKWIIVIKGSANPAEAS